MSVDVELVCAVDPCDEPPAAGVLCARHQEVFDQTVPATLEKRFNPDDLTPEELAVLRARLRSDAAPLFLAAIGFCVQRAVERF